MIYTGKVLLLYNIYIGDTLPVYCERLSTYDPMYRWLIELNTHMYVP